MDVNDVIIHSDDEIIDLTSDAEDFAPPGTTSGLPQRGCRNSSRRDAIRDDDEVRSRACGKGEDSCTGNIEASNRFVVIAGATIPRHAFVLGDCRANAHTPRPS